METNTKTLLLFYFGLSYVLSTLIYFFFISLSTRNTLYFVVCACLEGLFICGSFFMLSCRYCAFLQNCLLGADFQCWRKGAVSVFCTKPTSGKNSESIVLGLKPLA